MNGSSAKNFMGEVTITIVSGPEKGTLYKLLGQTVTVGRDPSNDVVLLDPRSSRNHCRFELRGSDYWIKDGGSQNGVVVNGKNVREGRLNPGDMITIGSTSIRFGNPAPLTLQGPTAMTGTGSVPTKNDRPLGPQQARQGEWLPPDSKKKMYRVSAQPQQLRLMAIVAVGIIIAVILATSSTSPIKKRSTEIKDTEALSKTIEATSTTAEKLREEIIKKGKNTQQYAEAQALYMRGFREFREGNYIRAIQNFEGALALYPDLPLAKRYLERSQLKRSEMVSAAMTRAEKAFLLHKYGIALNEYRTVKVLLDNPNSPQSQLADKRMEEIRLTMINNK